MGANRRSSKQFFRPLQGSIVTKPDYSPGDVRKFEVREDDFREYAAFGSLDGVIEDVKFVDSDYNAYGQLQIHLRDGTEEFVLVLGADSSEASSFCNSMKNINFHEPVIFTHYLPNGKERHVLGVSQMKDGKFTPVPWHFQNPKDEVPSWKSFKRGNKTEWDATDTVEFWKAHVKEVWQDVLANGNPAKTAKAVVIDDEDDDLPF